jgi:hypothetical protein
MLLQILRLLCAAVFGGALAYQNIYLPQPRCWLLIGLFIIYGALNVEWK